MGAVANTAGKNTPFTEIKAEPNVILAIENQKVILGFGQKKRAKKTEKSFSQIAGFSPRKIKEFTFDKSEDLKVGGKITVAVFEPGDLVKVTGVTKGRGFAGGVKRWGFAGGPKTHGQSDRHRAIGSIGAGTTPGRVYKGKRMPGHMGAAKQTVINLEIVDVDEKNNMLLVKGAIPGPRNGFVIVKKVGKVKNFVPYKHEPLPEENQEPVEADQNTETEGQKVEAVQDENKQEQKETEDVQTEAQQVTETESEDANEKAPNGQVKEEENAQNNQ